ncbi:MAG: hypothetical protein US40_C0007G0060 [Candidatus Roizmanbacteria bacterium GW2011_GWC2_37_13]|uniref:Carrier domain-containing protein n=1 Tax=Candidatus Roizmanbacteria bacterium GW2011_GWC2_37_13 TaxID=1618486 RepID=A0A0G0JBM5_9BACT|nr:MAG: hypothetical protein US38_C0012G0063 [Candidatus Roizmanbacteria bacterium GW2011_GWC1_37_12]KKQ25561.1 MAG: hypothetical protein US40_C0007G0060 [Candidatus Roizmanbacteria bacterium GW2011_GWC2_37_13]
MISRNLLLELKQILEEDFHLKLSLQEVTEIGTNLLVFVETLLKVESIEIQGGKQNGNSK